MKGKVVVLMGSERDLEFCRDIVGHLKTLGLTYELRVASAHKTPEKVLKIKRLPRSLPSTSLRDGEQRRTVRSLAMTKTGF